MNHEVMAFLTAIERLLMQSMPPVRRAELENLHRIWVARLKNTAS